MVPLLIFGGITDRILKNTKKIYIYIFFLFCIYFNIYIYASVDHTV